MFHRPEEDWEVTCPECDEQMDRTADGFWYCEGCGGEFSVTMERGDDTQYVEYIPDNRKDD